MATHRFFIIYSICPDELNNECKTFVEAFDTLPDAQYVLAALEKVNINHNTYRIEQSIVT